MQAKHVTRALLALILLCLLILLLRNFFGNGETAPAPQQAVEPQPPAQPAPATPPQPTAQSRVEQDAFPEEPLEQPELGVFIDALLGDELPADVRAWTARALRATPGPEVTQALLDALNDPSPEVAEAAAEALEGRDDPRVGPALEKLHRDRPPKLSSQAPESMRIETLD